MLSKRQIKVTGIGNKDFDPVEQIGDGANTEPKKMPLGRTEASTAAASKNEYPCIYMLGTL
jgi:hypothetical protein